MKIVSLAHLKGGVGKTTAAVNIAYLASKSGVSTLLVDLDAQAAATYLFRMDSAVGGKAKKVAGAKKSLRDRIADSEYPNLDLLPATFSYRKLPVLLAENREGKKPSGGIGRMLSRVGKPYRLVVVDSPSGLTLENEEIIQASNLILAPIVPSPLALKSFHTLREFVSSCDIQGVLRGFVSMVDRRKAIHREVADALIAGGVDVWPVAVPYASAIERMSVERLPISRVKRPGEALSSFRKLWELCAEELDLV